MKINFAKLLAVAAQIVVAIPAVAAAVKPVADAVKKPRVPVSVGSSDKRS